jgi:hypothetical protein
VCRCHGFKPAPLFANKAVRAAKIFSLARKFPGGCIGAGSFQVGSLGRMRMRIPPGLVSISCLFCALAGCSGTAGPSVKGQVLFDGKPVSDARVVFEGVGGSAAATDEEGKFHLDGTTFKTVKPGKYIVRISKLVDKKTGKVPDREDYDQLLAADGLKNLLPAKYNQKEENPLIAEIKEGANDLPPFQLKK